MFLRVAEHSEGGRLEGEGGRRRGKEKGEGVGWQVIYQQGRKKCGGEIREMVTTWFGGNT